MSGNIFKLMIKTFMAGYTLIIIKKEENGKT